MLFNFSSYASSDTTTSTLKYRGIKKKFSLRLYNSLYHLLSFESMCRALLLLRSLCLVVAVCQLIEVTVTAMWKAMQVCNEFHTVVKKSRKLPPSAFHVLVLCMTLGYFQKPLYFLWILIVLSFKRFANMVR